MKRDFGLHVNARGLIQQLKNNLIDRYPRDSILKELLQNADDARATRLEFGWSSGFAGAEHPLLRGPALFAVNDGPFEKQDAEAIRSFGLNYKAADRGTIGKFGLGLKSVFHLCEAFFFLASPELNSAAAVNPISSIVNPWCGTGFHEDWNEFTPTDQETVRRHLAPLLGLRDWFVLWLPLRRGTDCRVDPVSGGVGALGPGASEVALHADHPGDCASCPEDLLAAQADFFADQLPLLRHLCRVRMWDRWDGSDAVHPQFDVELPIDASRSRFPERLDVVAGGSSTVRVEVRGERNDLTYTVRQGWLGEMEDFKNRPGWPMSFSFASFLQTPDKALPHVAVSLSRWPSATGGGLTIARAVFLPLRGDDEVLTCDGKGKYSLKLHGCFFVDAGRGRPAYSGNGPAEASSSPEDQLRREWNERLLREGVCPLLIPTLEEFALSSGLGDAGIRSLTRSLGGSQFVKEHLADICRAEQWLYSWSPIDSGWRRLPITTDFLEIPDYDATGPSLVADTLPGLCGVVKDGARLTPANWPILTTRPRREWSDDLLAKVLDPSAISFSAWDRHHWECLDQFLTASLHAAPGPLASAALAVLVRQSFASVAIHDLRKHKASIQRVISRLTPDRRLALSIPATWSEQERRNVTEWPVALTIIPGEFDPPDARSRGRLSPDDAVELLSLLRQGCEQHLTSEPAADVVLATDLDSLRKQPQFKDLKLWVAECFEGSRTTSVILCDSQLSGELANGLLYRGEPDEVRMLAKALDGVAVYLLPWKTAHLLFGSEGVPTCDLAALAKVLAGHPRLPDPSNRVALLKYLLGGQRYPAIADLWRRAVRYLLHGRRDGAEGEGALLTRDPRAGSVWGRIAHAHLERTDGGWRVLPTEPLVGLLNPVQREEVGVEAIDSNGVAKLLRAEDARVVSIEFPDEERDQVLLGWRSWPELLKAMPLHDGVRGGRHRIGSGCYWQSRYTLEGPLAERVTLLRQCSDPALAAIQRTLATELLPADIIHLALDAGAVDHWAVLMDAVAGSGTMAKDIRERLIAVEWLPLEGGKVASPRRVLIDVDHELDQEIGRALAVVPDAGWVGSARLATVIRNHKGYDALVRLCAPSRGDVLGNLAGVLSRADDHFRIGMRLDDENEIEDWIRAFADATNGITRVRDLFDQVWKSNKTICRERFLPPLMPDKGETALESLRASALLEFLRNEYDKSTGQKKAAVRRVHDRYLDIASTSPKWRNLLPTLRLLNANGEWADVRALCVATGLAPAKTLDIEQTRLLHGKVSSQEPRKIVGKSTQSGQELGDLRIEWYKSAEALKIYFEPWEKQSDDYAAWVGAFLGILGDYPSIKDLAAKFLPQGRSADAVRSAANFSPRVRRAADGQQITDSTAEMMRLQHFLVEVTEQKPIIQVVNLLGQLFAVEPVSSCEDLLIGYGIRKLDNRIEGDSQVHWLNLRRVDLKTADPRTVRGWVDATANRVLREVYGQKNPRFAEAIPGLTDRDHEIRAAQSIALDAQHTLRQLGHLASKELLEVLGQFDKAADRKAEEQVVCEKGKELDGTKAEELERAARETLRQLIESSDVAKDQLLASLRRKLGEYRYRPNAVLFELFQNADDACVELGGDETAVFALRLDAEGLTAMHSGRPINRPSSVVVKEKAARDLRKMLALGHSDKGHSGPAVTGRFGLGFKSIFLLGDRPQLLSGQLGVEVLGGLYPKPLGKLSGDELRAALRSVELKESQGTACRIAYRSDVSGQEVVAPYRRLAHFLGVFARKIRRCRLLDEQGVPWDASWDETSLDESGTVVTGILKPFPEGGSASSLRAVVLRVDDAALLLRIDARGFIRLPKTVPTVWATAPTEEAHDLGYAVNGPFVLDVGRSQVDWNADENGRLLDRLGRGFGAGLISLFDAGDGEGWPGLRGRLGIAGGDHYSFWASFWAAFAIDGGGPALLRQMMWGSLDQGVAKLYGERKALPTGIPLDGHRTLTTLGTVTAVLAGSLDTDGDAALVRRVADWPAFRSIVAGTVVSARIWERLSRLTPQLATHRNPVDLATLLALELRRNDQVPPVRATHLGKAVNRKQLDSLDAGLEPARAESGRIQEAGRSARFLAVDDSWQSARNLIIATQLRSGSEDEPLRAAFAPANRILHASYHDGDNAVEFFIACRHRLEAPIEEMVAWAIAADPSRREGVKVYLRDGEQGVKLAQRLRSRSSEVSWLTPLLSHPLFINQAGPESIFPDPAPVRLSPECKLQRIADWWQGEFVERVRRYDDQAIPNGGMVRAITEAEGETEGTRSAWLRLFISGILATIGRVKAAQNRGFLQLCDERGWFETLLDHHGSTEWLYAVENYIDEPAQDIRYFHWLGKFLGIAFTARHLDAFIASFRAIDQISARFRMDEILATRTSHHFAGSGLDAPPLGPVLGIGACVVLRELVRGGVVRSTHAHPYCYPPVSRVRELLEGIGWDGGQGYDDRPWEMSRSIYEFLRQHLADPTFGGAFDLPFLALADDRDLRVRILGV